MFDLDCRVKSGNDLHGRRAAHLAGEASIYIVPKSHNRSPGCDFCLIQIFSFCKNFILDKIIEICYKRDSKRIINKIIIPMNLNFSDFIIRMREARVSIKESEMFIMFCWKEAFQSIDYREKSNLGMLIFNLICDASGLGTSQWEKDVQTAVTLYPCTARLFDKNFAIKQALLNRKKVAELSDALSAKIWEEAEQLEALENGSWQPNLAFFTPDAFDEEN